MHSLNSEQSAFIASVLDLNARVAAFDCDGTLWSGDAGEGFFSWEIEEGLVSEEIGRWGRARYADYRAGKVAEDIMCGEMVTMHRGLREDMVQQAADRYFELGVAANIFPEMRELVSRLQQAGCQVWAVSSSNLWIIRSAMRAFGVPLNRILAAETVVQDGIILDRLIRVPCGPDKPKAIREAIDGDPDCAFGNSIWDREMLEMARHPFVINPNPNLREIGLARRWTIYQPEVNHQGR